MRYRTLLSTRRPIDVGVVGYVGIDRRNFIPHDSSYSDYNRGDGYAREEIMTDESTPKGSRSVPHSCTHTKCVGAWFQNQRLSMTFDSSPSPATLNVTGAYMRSIFPIVPAFPAGALVDSLASLVDGNVKTKLSLPIFLLEGAKTIAMLRNPFNVLKPSFRRQVGKLTASSLAKSGANVWLEYLYGWKQFKSDVDGIAQATATFLGSADTRKYLDQERRVSVSSKQTLASGVIEYNAGSPSYLWDMYGDILGWSNNAGGLYRFADVSTSVVYRLGCLHQERAWSAISRTRQLLQLTSAMPNWQTIRDTIWEVVPFSFVIDWFIDTRGIWYAQNVSRLSELGVYNVCYSTKVTSQYHVDWRPMPTIFQYGTSNPWSYKTPTSYDVKYIRTTDMGTMSSYTRTLGFPVSDGVVTSALSAKGLSVSKLGTAAALIAQRIFK